ncbi:DMT family transporter [Roseimarinus sediminis]|jgi:drug/metabolite transporter (DMT)-like permease|uniref:DMT family transporter n=1 Tax=Roseimarinus sediminis TaxID=1610899 RepID=UPI003D19D28F
MSEDLRKLMKGTAFLAIVACFLWATAFAGVKIGLKYMSPLQFAGIRFFISGLMIMAFYGKIGAYVQALRTHFSYILLIAFLQTVLMYSLFYTGINMVPGAVGAMVIGSGPLFAAIVAHFAMHNDKMNLRTTGGILLGILGIVIINLGRQTKGIAGAYELLGVVILIGNNLVSGFYNVVVMKSKRNISMLVLSSASLWIGGLVLFLIGWSFEGWQLNRVFPAEFWLALAWLSFLSAAAFAIWFTLLRRPGVKISHLNTWKFIIPVLGAILSWLLLPDESPDAYAIAGMIVVGAAMLVMNHEAITGGLQKQFGRK